MFSANNLDGESGHWDPGNGYAKTENSLTFPGNERMAECFAPVKDQE